jgi:pimeloyl-ACP methyl ester carboxylesterase
MVVSAEHVAGPSRYERLDDLGHWMQLEAPDAVTGLFWTFCAGDQGTCLVKADSLVGVGQPLIAGSSLVVDVDGPCHYLDMGGPPDGPLIVALHGLGGSHLNWTAVGPLLTGGARVLALDLVGHGLTPVGHRHADIEGHRRLVSGFLRTVGGGPAILMGNSMGGLVAARPAAPAPESTGGLILIDPALPTSRLGLVHPRIIANFVLCAVPGVGEGYLSQRRRRTTAEQSVRRVLGVCCVAASRVPPDVVEAHIELTEHLDRAAGDVAYLRSARSLSGLLARPAVTVERLGRIRQPALLLQGARDVLVPLAAARRMSADHPDWQFEVAEDVGHVPMLEAPAWTASAISGWLAGRGLAS